MDIRRNYSRIFFLRCNLFYKEVFSLSNNLTRNTSISVSVYYSSHLMSNPLREALFRFIGIFVGLEPSHFAVVVMVIIFLCGTILCLIILPPKQPPTTHLLKLNNLFTPSIICPGCLSHSKSEIQCHLTLERYKSVEDIK